VKEVPIRFADRKHVKSKLSIQEQLSYLQRISRSYCYQLNRWLSRTDYWPVAMLACVSLSVLAALAFLRWQSIWVDETTQLFGLTLGAVGLTRWLAGQHQPFLVPPDRMPPLSYWAEWCWTQLFGSGVQTLRTFGVACVAGAVAVTFSTARRAFDNRAAVLAALLLGLAPNVVTTGVEIRAYPLFLLEASLGFYCLVRYCSDAPDQSRRWLWRMTLVCIAGIYTHFFGLILAGALLLGAAVASWKRFAELRGPTISMAVLSVCAVGLVPFVRAAFAISGANPNDPTARALGLKSTVGSIAKLAYHLCAHPATALNAGAVAAAVGGVALLSLVIILRIKSAGVTQWSLAATLGSGLAVVVSSSLVFRGFDSLAPSYNIWMLPGFYLLLAAGVTGGQRHLRRLAAVGAILLLGANVYTDIQLAIHGGEFAHGTEPQLEALVNRFGGPGKVAIVYENGSGSPEALNAWPFVYFPLAYTYKKALLQYVADDTAAGSVHDCNVAGPDSSPLDIARPYLFVIRARQEYTHDLVMQVPGGMVPFGPGPICRLVEKSAQWKHLGEQCFLSLQASQVDIFQSRQVTTITAEAHR
jgi:Dolichyl-phosphate-mannose-protein mannosyltransferase